MDYHHHARLTIYRREELAETVIQGRLSLKEAAAEFKLSRQSAAKWVRRFRAEKQARLARSQLAPASLAPLHLPGIDRSRDSDCDASVGRGCASPKPPA